MSRKASGLPKTKRVERLQKNGDTYIYEVVTDHSCQSGNCSANIRILFQYYPDAFGRRRRLPSDDTCSFAFSPVTTGAYSA
jgi:hypothetical protein